MKPREKKTKHIVSSLESRTSPELKLMRSVQMQNTNNYAHGRRHLNWGWNVRGLNTKHSDQKLTKTNSLSNELQNLLGLLRWSIAILHLYSNRLTISFGQPSIIAGGEFVLGLLLLPTSFCTFNKGFIFLYFSRLTATFRGIKSNKPVPSFH